MNPITILLKVVKIAGQMENKGLEQYYEIGDES